jgi:DNA modification methylase
MTVGGKDVSDIILHHGDCLAILPTMEAGSVGAVIADPPYGIGHSSNRDNRQGTASASWKGRQILGDHDAALRDWIIGWAEERGIPWAVFGNWKCQRPAKTRGVLIWDKGPAFGMGDLSFPWKMSWEEIYIGGPGWSGSRDEGVLRGHQVVSWESRGRKHPHQKPVSLILHLLKKLPPNIVVVDPTAGSGSTGVACMKAGRSAILIEQDPDWIPVIERRLDEAKTPLFQGL